MFCLADIRKKEQKTQQQLADTLFIKRQTISAIENGSKPSPRLAQKIAEELNFDKYGLSWVVFFEDFQYAKTEEDFA